MFPEGRSSLYRAKFPDFEVVVAGSSTRKVDSGKKVKLVAVPLLPIYAGTRGETGDQHTNLDQVSAEEMIAAFHLVPQSRRDELPGRQRRVHEPDDRKW